MLSWVLTILFQEWQDRLSSPLGTNDALVVSLALSGLTVLHSCPCVLFFVLIFHLQI